MQKIFRSKGCNSVYSRIRTILQTGFKKQELPGHPWGCLRSILILALSISLIAAAQAQSQGWSPQPWLEDLGQAQQAFKLKYANIDWLEHDREISLASLFASASSQLRSARSDKEARAIFNRLIQTVGDGHVEIDWPASLAPSANEAPAASKPYDACDDLGFDAGRSKPGIGSHLPGYQEIGHDNPFHAGLISVGTRKVGVIRIGGFEPQGVPQICRAALQALHRQAQSPCNDQCKDAILKTSYDELTVALEELVRTLRAHGATLLLVDITDNGGGSQWAEAAARIVSAKPLTSERRGYVRGPHWTEQWQTFADQFRQAADISEPEDRERLLSWAREADNARTDAAQSCAVEGTCSLIGMAGYSTGLLGAARVEEIGQKPWADLVFSPAQFPYHDSVWSGPLIVLVDEETWSAAEEFAAVLQDNKAAVIMGTRTGGAGCGHTNGGTPTTLTNSGATLELPDCIRFRADGSNEVEGVIPDIMTGMKASDGPTFKVKLIEQHLPMAVRLATQDDIFARGSGYLGKGPSKPGF